MLRNKRKKTIKMIDGYRKTGTLFLDSGIFESDWKSDSTWNLESYKSVLSQSKFDVFSCYDVLPYPEKFKNYEEFKKEAFKCIIESSAFLNKGVFLVILHGSSPNKLIKLARDFIIKYPDIFTGIAIPERDCGKEILERTETIVRLRKLLNEHHKKSILHILGCGNPLSMLLYTYCGADTFDSLDWLERVIEPERLSLGDFPYLNHINCECPVCVDSKYVNSDYIEKVLLHNLLFYQNFSIRLQNLIRNNLISTYLTTFFDKEFIKQIDSL